MHEELCTLLGSRNVYFQPPESVKMQYPAIRYNLGGYDIDKANNGNYRTLPTYEGVLIDRNPDSEFIEKILQLPYCSLGRPYVVDNLNHYPFTIYY